MTAPTTLESCLREWCRGQSARLEVFPEAENLIRVAGGGEGPERFVIEVQGLPNLLHEVGHVLLHGRLEKDHGTEVSRLPFSLDREEDRRLLHHELACCALSCRWHPGRREAAHAWFDEQVGIQAIFYGEDRDSDAFLDRLDHAMDQHAPPVQEALDEAEDRLIEGLSAVDTPSPLLEPRHALGFLQWWRHLRADRDEARDPGTR